MRILVCYPPNAKTRRKNGRNERMVLSNRKNKGHTIASLAVVNAALEVDHPLDSPWIFVDPSEVSHQTHWTKWPLNPGFLGAFGQGGPPNYELFVDKRITWHILV